MTTRRVVTTRRADEDIDDAIAYYLREGATGAAIGFVDELQRSTDLMAQHPAIGSPRFAIEMNIAELRSLRLRRFPYVVVYLEDADAVRVVRVLHSSRDIPAALLE